MRHSDFIKAFPYHFGTRCALQVLQDACVIPHPITDETIKKWVEDEVKTVAFRPFKSLDLDQCNDQWYQQTVGTRWFGGKSHPVRAKWCDVFILYGSHREQSRLQSSWTSCLGWTDYSKTEVPYQWIGSEDVSVVSKISLRKSIRTELQFKERILGGIVRTSVLEVTGYTRIVTFDIYKCPRGAIFA